MVNYVTRKGLSMVRGGEDEPAEHAGSRVMFA